MANTSSSVDTQWNVSCLRTSSGMSSRSASLSFGRMIVRDARAVRAEHLLLHAADRQHAAAQRDLAGHRDVAAHRAARHRRHERRRHRHAGATGRPSGSRPPARGCAPRSSRGGPRGICSVARVRRGVGERGARRLLHHVAELAGEDQRHVAPAAHLRPSRRPVDAGAPASRRIAASTNMMSPPTGV